MTTSTDYSKKCKILKEAFVDYNNDERFDDFILENDLGLPLAYLIVNGVVESTPKAEKFIEMSFTDLLELLDVEDTGFNSLSDIIKKL
jgi:hypothetical protein